MCGLCYLLTNCKTTLKTLEKCTMYKKFFSIFSKCHRPRQQIECFAILPSRLDLHLYCWHCTASDIVPLIFIFCPLDATIERYCSNSLSSQKKKQFRFQVTRWSNNAQLLVRITCLLVLTKKSLATKVCMSYWLSSFTAPNCRWRSKLKQQAGISKIHLKLT